MCRLLDDVLYRIMPWLYALYIVAKLMSFMSSTILSMLDLGTRETTGSTIIYQLLQYTVITLQQCIPYSQPHDGLEPKIESVKPG